jgi:serine/threonine protein kinase
MNEQQHPVPGAEPRRATDATSQLFGRFRILRTLAFGGMAQILLARETRSGQLVVIKRILPHYAQNAEFVQFFIHEGRLGQRLIHPNVVQTLEAGQVEDTCYIALEYLRGQPAIELLRAAARAKVDVPLGVAVRIVADAARGLHHAHMACDAEGRPLNVVHRDVTPHNLYVCTDGNTKVLDFGIAKAASQLHHTRTGTIKGKFAYLAPEQIKGEGIDHRVDVFALGIVLHELLTLKPLFRGNNDAETLQKVLSLEVAPPERVRQGVPPGLGAVALRELQRDRERRLPSALALADSIEAVAAAEGIDASPQAVAKLLHRLFPNAEDLGELSLPEEATTDSPPEGVPETPPTGVESMDDAIPTMLNELPTVPVTLHPHPQVAGDVASTFTQLRARRRTGRAALLVAAAAVVLGVALASTTCQHPQVSARSAAPPAPPPRDNEGAPAAPNVEAVPALPAPEGAPSPQAAPAIAEATLRVQTEGVATFVVDGHALKPAADGALHLAAGKHTVIVSSSTLAFPRTIAIDLKPKEAALRAVHGGKGQLRVAVTPWAEVIVDGRTLGVTPLQPSDLPEGPHTVVLKNGDLGVTTKRRIVIAPNKESVLKVDLFSEKKGG